MNIDTQLLFLFSAIGALNSLMLSFYFAFFTKQNKVSNYFLAALLFVISIRIIKSVFFYFNPDLSEVFIQIGLSACVLIGPFLYLYIESSYSREKQKLWFLHIVTFICIITLFGILYPYWSYNTYWSHYFIPSIYLLWFVYIIFTGYKLRKVFKKLYSKEDNLSDSELWILSVYIGVFLIWIGYNVGSYTSYIVGSLSFSFVFYLTFLFWVLKRKKKSFFFEDPIKYADRKIKSSEAQSIAIDLSFVMQEKKLFENPNLKLSDVAKELNLLPHSLSQYLNDNLGKSFPLFINEYRIEAAKQLLINKYDYTAEAIGYECGFNSKSTFFTTFKNLTGFTPSNYRKNDS